MDAELRALRQRVGAAPGDVELRAAYHRALFRGHGTSPLGLLRDRVAYAAAEPDLQDAAIEWAREDLRLDWEWVETCSYTCGGQAHRLAAFRHRLTGIRFHLLPGGVYLQGTVDLNAELAFVGDAVSVEEVFSEDPAHRVRIEPFLVSRTPLTRGEWERRPIHGGQRGWIFDQFPGADVPLVFSDPLVIDGWINQTRGLRLPSEAEWEYACRAGTTTRFFWGDEPDLSRCWSSANALPGTSLHPATAGLHTNAFGLLDMLGNAWEVCRDTSGPRPTPYAEASGDQRARVREGEHPGRILRGGGAHEDPARCRSAQRRSLGWEIPGLTARLCASLPGVDGEVRGTLAHKLLGQVQVDLLQRDIAEHVADVIVNAANHQLQMGGGVAGALRDAGGPEIQRSASRFAPAPLGSVVKTPAGDLQAKWVYHAVVTRYNQERARTSPEDVRAAMRKVMTAAAQDRVQRMAVPLLAAGVGGLSIEASLTALLETIEECAEQAPALHLVDVVVQDADEFQEARRAWEGFKQLPERQAEIDRSAEDYMRQLMERDEE